VRVILLLRDRPGAGLQHWVGQHLVGLHRICRRRHEQREKEVRCLVCRNEAIDDSNADLARDLRLLVRERLVAGDSDAEVLDYLVERYGEFVLLKPKFSAANAALWLAGPAAFLLGLIAIVAYHRTRRPHAAANAAPLSTEEKKRLDDILNG